MQNQKWNLQTFSDSTLSASPIWRFEHDSRNHSIRYGKRCRFEEFGFLFHPFPHFGQSYRESIRAKHLKSSPHWRISTIWRTHWRCSQFFFGHFESTSRYLHKLGSNWFIWSMSSSQLGAHSVVIARSFSMVSRCWE